MLLTHTNNYGYIHIHSVCAFSFSPPSPHSLMVSQSLISNSKSSYTFASHSLSALSSGKLSEPGLGEACHMSVPLRTENSSLLFSAHYQLREPVLSGYSWAVSDCNSIHKTCTS